MAAFLTLVLTTAALIYVAGGIQQYQVRFLPHHHHIAFSLLHIGHLISHLPSDFTLFQTILTLFLPASSRPRLDLRSLCSPSSVISRSLFYLSASRCSSWLHSSLCKFVSRGGVRSALVESWRRLSSPSRIRTSTRLSCCFHPASYCSMFNFLSATSLWTRSVLRIHANISINTSTL